MVLSKSLNTASLCPWGIRAETSSATTTTTTSANSKKNNNNEIIRRQATSVKAPLDEGLSRTASVVNMGSKLLTSVSPETLACERRSDEAQMTDNKKMERTGAAYVSCIRNDTSRTWARRWA
jgi:hypothetical protein